MNGFTSINNSFIGDDRFTLAEKMILIWLASKPVDWQVREQQVQKELGIGRGTTQRILCALRDKGAITKPDPAQGANGRWMRPPSHLAIRDEIRYVSAMRTEPPKSGGRSDQGEDESPNPRFPRVGSPRLGFPGDTSNEGTTNEGTPKSIQNITENDLDDMETLSKAATRQAAGDEIPPFMRDNDGEVPQPAVAEFSADENLSPADELRMLVRNAPTAKTLDSLWEHHKADFDAEVIELAKARKAQLASA